MKNKIYKALQPNYQARLDTLESICGSNETNRWQIHNARRQSKWLTYLIIAYMIWTIVSHIYIILKIQ